MGIEWVHEAAGVAYNGPAVPGDFGGVVGEVLVVAVVVFDGFGVFEHDFADGVLKEVFLEAFGHGAVPGRGEEAFVPGDASGDFAVVEGDDP